MHHLNKGLDVYLKHYDNLLILGEPNFDLKDGYLNAFSNVNLKSLNKEPTCFKTQNNPPYIDLFLTNRRSYFQNTSTIETGISDFHKFVVTVQKCSIKSKSRKLFNTETIKLVVSNYLELKWTKSWQRASSIFSSELKKVTLYPFIKRKANFISKIIVLLVSLPFSPNFMKGKCLIKCI